MRTVLFGLDGATFTVLDKLVADGLMPNLKSFYSDGVRAKLLATPLPITPQAWTSMATGCYMGKHGVNDFVRIEIGERGIFAKYNSSRDIHCDTIWKYASRNGRRVTALNYIGLAPPEPINGHSIPGFVPGRHSRRSSYPPDLFTRLEQVENFDVSILGLDLDVEKQVLKEMPADRWLPWIDHHIAREQVWFAVMEHLMNNEPSDLTAIVFDGVDKLQHLAYRYLDPAWAPANPSPWESTVIERCRDYFKQVDDFLGRTLDLVGDDGRVFIASDHGFTASTELLYINTFLKNEGFLTWTEQVKEDNQDTVYVDKLQNHLGLIDIQRTKAFAVTPSCNGIFINVPPEEYAGFRRHLIDRLYSIQGPDGGQVITEIKVREEWFAGPYMHHAADLTLTLRDYGLISVLNGSDVVVPRKSPWGTHHPDGVLLGRGPGLRAGEIVDRRNIVDVAALLMHSMQLDIPAEIDGRFPATMYDPAYLTKDPARIAQPANAAALDEEREVDEMDEEDEALLLQRLRSLGYVEQIMSRVNLNGVGISVRVSNPSADGPVALLIHGLNTNLAFWHPLLVRRLGDSHRLIMYDQRGHGYSDLPPSGYTSADLAGDAAALLEEFQVESADVIAHSFGATVALQLLRLHPERVRSLVILDGRARLLQPEVRIGEWSQFQRWQQHFAAVGIELDPELELDFELPLHVSSEMWASAREGLAKDGFFVPGSGRPAQAKYARLLQETTAPHDFRQLAGLTRESLRQIARPVAAVYGANSPYMPTARGLLDEIPGCRFVSIPGGGHNFPFLQPDATLAAIQDFWAKSLNKGTAPS